MSASLVGSEMCIRDRTVTDWCSSPAPTAPRTLASLGPHRGFAANRSVSYTHLTLPTICSV
eukprot:7340570-Alexandrium_andersonii.AAC.1